MPRAQRKRINRKKLAIPTEMHLKKYVQIEGVNELISMLFNGQSFVYRLL